jgi:glycosyltransferase involved in cell wall biosynthesis
MLDYSIIVPIYNEAESITKQFSLIRKVLLEFHTSRKFEIIAVNDNSNDESEVILNSLNYENFKIIKNLSNLGYGLSIKNACLNSKYENIIICDCDLTYPFEELPKLINSYEKGFDMVIGNRVNMKRKESYTKNILRKFLKFIIFLGNSEIIKDPNSGFRIFKKQHLIQDMNLISNGFSLTATFTFISVFRHRLINFVDIELLDRVGKSKVRFLKDSLRLLQFLFNIWLYFNATKFFIILSAFFFLLFMILLLFANSSFYQVLFLFFSLLSLILGLTKLGNDK